VRRLLIPFLTEASFHPFQSAFPENAYDDWKLENTGGKPEFAEKILRGEKHFEFRKTVPPKRPLPAALTLGQRRQQQHRRKPRHTRRHPAPRASLPERLHLARLRELIERALHGPLARA
jgi:hypothetical protein